MTITRLLGIVFGVVLVVRFCMPLFAVFKPQIRQQLRQLQVVIDVAGGLVLLIIAGSVWWRGRPEVALLVLLLGIPVFIGAWRALPAWWYGHK
jgi:Na+/alanine symporter